MSSPVRFRWTFVGCGCGGTCGEAVNGGGDERIGAATSGGGAVGPRPEVSARAGRSPAFATNAKAASTPQRRRLARVFIASPSQVRQPHEPDFDVAAVEVH